ncbi:two-component regulator propeller domain-containing protein [Chitinispirillales bacterium ANBcel5]|uniref:ligand-binding sensor domain-containing protein n=1 Tax=Cellulosispirillum alkaliphilum TaxID=3039283 RepID=UPI002A50B741|nr:two-component regulator propeller domain-containing protein [Chitinispirillales bacterium ANBcel5]
MNRVVTGMKKIVVLFFLLLGLPIVAQDITNYINYLDVSTTYLDDDELWVGTNTTGLFMYNRSTKKKTIYNDDNTFFGDKVNRVLKDQQNRIWVAWPRAIAYKYKGEWEKLDPLIDRVYDFTLDNTGNIWAIGLGGVVRTSGGSFETISTPVDLTNDPLRGIASGYDNGKIYVVTDSRILKYNTDGSYYGNIDQPRNTPLSVAIDNLNRIFLTYSTGIFRLENETWINSSFNVPITDLNVSEDGYVWAYNRNSIHVYDQNQWQLILQYRNDVGYIKSVQPHSKTEALIGGDFFLGYLEGSFIHPAFSNISPIIESKAPRGNTIRFLYTDNSGTVWTYADFDPEGVRQFVNEKWQSTVYGPSISNQTTRMISRDDEVWFLNSQGVQILERNSLSGFEYSGRGILNDLVFDKSDSLWFATSRGVGKYNGVEFYEDRNPGFQSNNMTSLLVTKDSSLWVGGYEGTLAFYSNNIWTQRTLSKPATITMLAQDSLGSLWIGTNNGLVNIGKNDSEVWYTTHNGLGSNNIQDIRVDTYNRIWVATTSGLSYLENETWKTLDRSLGLAGNYVSSLTISKDTILWIGTDRGISALNLNSHTISVEDSNRRLNPATKRYKQSKLQINLENNRIFHSPDNNFYLLNGRKINPSNNKRKLPSMIYIESNAFQKTGSRGRPESSGNQ